jgi:hypothetical protein
LQQTSANVKEQGVDRLSNVLPAARQFFAARMACRSQLNLGIR